MDYMLKKNYPLKMNSKKTSKSQSIKHNNNIQKNKNIKYSKYSPSITLNGETYKNYFSGNLKKYKSTNKAISLNSLPNIEPYFVTNNINQNQKKGQFELFVRNKTSFYKNSDLRDDNDEQFGEIELLWDELGITDEYQDQFEIYLNSMNNRETKNRFIMIEKNNLNKLKDSLIKFSKEKMNRNKNIELLKNLNIVLKDNNIFNENKISKDLLKEIIDCIKAIRINAVNIINSLIKVRESMNCYSLEDKINFERMHKNFLFDNNYLLKINSELSFLKYSEIDKIFEKIEDEEENFDTFLTKYVKTKKNEKEIIPISKELMNAIDKSRYYIMQDSFLNNIRTKKLLKLNNKHTPTQKFNKNTKVNSLMALSNMGFRDNNNNFMDVKLHKLKNELGNDYNNIFLNTNKPYPAININNNKRYNLLKNQINKTKKNNIIIERIDSPYKINENDKKNDLKSEEKNGKELYKDFIDEEISKLNYYKKNKKYNEEEIVNEVNFKKDNNNDKNQINENDKKETNDNNDKNQINWNDKKDENDNNDNYKIIENYKNDNNDKNKIIENESNETNKNENLKKEEEQNKENKKKKEDEEDKIIDMDYLDYIREK